MTSTKPWEMNTLQNSSQILRNSNPNVPSTSQSLGRSTPILPPLPRSFSSTPGYNSYMPYSSGFNNLGYGGYGSYGMPYRNSLYPNTYGGYNNFGGYQGAYGLGADDAERRFIQYAEERSRNAFENVESIVRVFNSISMMLDNTFFAMTSSFRAVLSVAENFGKLKNMFGQIWYSINLFRLFNYLYRKLLWLTGISKNSKSLAWNQAIGQNNNQQSHGSSWPTFAFLGVVLSIPYIISKFLPKYEDRANPLTWKSPGIQAKAAFDFVARSSNELSFQTNDVITLAPTYVQDEMNLKNSGWAFAISNGKCGVVPLNYVVIIKKSLRDHKESQPLNKTHQKRVSFGENQIFDLGEYNNLVNNNNYSTDNQKKMVETENRNTDADTCL